MGSRASFPIVSLPKERVIIVTGANSGIGYEIAKWCAMLGATVIMACRSEQRTREAMQRMQEEFEAEKAVGKLKLTDDPKLSLEFMKLDLGSYKSVISFCDEFKKTARPLHVLFLNAGIAFLPYLRTEDDQEQTLQVNYLSHFIITAKLLPVMKTSGPDCRILLISSNGYSMGNFDLNTMDYKGTPSDMPLFDYYGRSKLYQIMQTFCMARRFKDSHITINALHPGLVHTQIARGTELRAYKCAKRCFSCFLRTPLQGAKCAIDLAVNPKHAGVSGNYWVDFKVVTPSRTARDQTKQEQLWTETFKYVGSYLTEDEIKGMEGP